MSQMTIDTGKASTNPQSLQRSRVQLSAVIEKAVLFSARLIASNRVDVHWDPLNVGEEPDRYCCWGDETLLRRVFVDLITNAVQSMPHGGILVLSIQPVTDRGGNRFVQIVFSDSSDSSAGIARDDLPRVFGPFCTTKLHGMGLGLTIVPTIVEAHQGWIEFVSDVGRGVTVTVTLPRVESDRESTNQESRAVSSSVSDGVRSNEIPLAQGMMQHV